MSYYDKDKPRTTVPGEAPGPLSYYVTPAKKAEDLIYGPEGVGACTDWARREAVQRAASLDVREADSGAVFFTFNAKGRFGR